MQVSEVCFHNIMKIASGRGFELYSNNIFYIKLELYSYDIAFEAHLKGACMCV